MRLSKAHEAELAFLKRRVDNAIDATRKVDRHPNVEQDLWRAREELEQFVTMLREQGHNI